MGLQAEGQAQGKQERAQQKGEHDATFGGDEGCQPS
jgi:hypothetical protein